MTVTEVRFALVKFDFTSSVKKFYTKNFEGNLKCNPTVRYGMFNISIKMIKGVEHEKVIMQLLLSQSNIIDKCSLFIFT